MLFGMLFRGPLSLKLNRDLHAVDTFVSHYQDESGMYCGFFIHVLMCTAYTNLANTFLISFPSKNSDLSSMLEAWTFKMIYSLSRLILSRFILSI